MSEWDDIIGEWHGFCHCEECGKKVVVRFLITTEGGTKKKVCYDCYIAHVNGFL